MPFALSGASEQPRQANGTPIWRGGLPAIRHTKTQIYLTSPDFTRLASFVKMNYIDSVNFKLKKKKLLLCRLVPQLVTLEVLSRRR